MRTTLSLILIMTLAVGGLAGKVANAQTLDANDVVINGESFFAASNIRDELNRLAREDGVIGPTESFRQIAVSGAVISQILGYYRNVTPKPKYVISDGGGNDLMDNCPSPATVDCPVVQNTFATVKAYFDTMAVHGTEKVLWMRYPDPQGNQWAMLKTNQDLFNPLVEQLCDTITTLSCLWVDLRPVWEGNYAQYTNDGIHATNAGGTVTAEAFWQAIVENDFFDLAPSTSIRSVKPTASQSAGGVEPVKVLATSAGSTGLTVRVDGTVLHTIDLHDATGRFVARRKGGPGAEHHFTVATQPGLYFVRVQFAGGELVRKVFVDN